MRPEKLCPVIPQNTGSSQPKAFNDLGTETMSTGRIIDPTIKERLTKILRTDGAKLLNSPKTRLAINLNGSKDGEFRVNKDGDKLISLERRDQAGGRMLALVRPQGKERFTETDSNLIYFNGLTEIDKLPGFQQLSKTPKPQTAPAVVTVLLREAEAIRDLYYYGNRVVHRQQVNSDYKYVKVNRSTADEAYFQLKGPNGNELDVRLDNKGAITNIQRISPEFTISIIPGNQAPITSQTSIEILNNTATEADSPIEVSVSYEAKPAKPVPPLTRTNGIDLEARRLLLQSVSNATSPLGDKLRRKSSSGQASN